MRAIIALWRSFEGIDPEATDLADIQERCAFPFRSAEPFGLPSGRMELKVEDSRRSLLALDGQPPSPANLHLWTTVFTSNSISYASGRGGGSVPLLKSRWHIVNSIHLCLK